MKSKPLTCKDLLNELSKLSEDELKFELVTWDNHLSTLKKINGIVPINNKNLMILYPLT